MSIQNEETRKLSKQWGDKPCDHPHLEKEYYLGTATGDYVCTTCGAAGSGRNWTQKRDEK